MRPYCLECLRERPAHGHCSCRSTCPDCGEPLETLDGWLICYPCDERVAIQTEYDQR